MMSGSYDMMPLAKANTLAGDLVARLLTLNMHARISAKNALDHPWIRMQLADTGGESTLDDNSMSTGCFGMCFRWNENKLFKDPSMSRLESQQHDNLMIYPDSTAHSVFRGLQLL
jgi:serine/threonine protein kinase